MRPVRLAAALVIAAPGLTAQEQDRERPESRLFQSNEPIEFTIRADFDQLKKDRDQEEEYRPGVIDVLHEDGTRSELEFKVKTRGKFRLQRSTCEFPPLRLNFPRDTIMGSPFDGEDKLKLVTHCRDRDSYEQNVLEEYLVYRGYNLVTDYSFRVRLAEITYEDTSGENDTVTRRGFVIEDEDEMAERLGGRIVEVAQVHPRHLQAATSADLSLFQYAIGNTDWSMVYFHNVKLVRLPDGDHVPVPYDFDWAGLVDAPYAKPDPSLRIRSVRQRVYRGFCRADVDMAGVYADFLKHKAPFEALIRDQPGLEEDNVKRAVEYLEDFFEMLDDPDKTERDVESACRRMT